MSEEINTNKQKLGEFEGRFNSLTVPELGEFEVRFHSLTVPDDFLHRQHNQSKIVDKVGPSLSSKHLRDAVGELKCGDIKEVDPSKNDPPSVVDSIEGKRPRGGPGVS